MLNRDELLRKIDSMEAAQLLPIMTKAFDAAGIPYEMKPGQITFIEAHTRGNVYCFGSLKDPNRPIPVLPQKEIDAAIERVKQMIGKK